ncbi:MAG: CsbD family protein [Planctomycetaceae bacterium]
MEANQNQGGWDQSSDSVTRNWSKWIGQQPTTIVQERQQLIDYLQKRYGYEKEQAESALDKELSCSH